MPPVDESMTPEMAPLALPRDLAGSESMPPVEGGGTSITAPAASGDPKLAQLPTGGEAEAPEGDTFVQAAEAPVPAPPAASPVAGVAAILLLAGLVLAGLRVVARRSA